MSRSFLPLLSLLAMACISCKTLDAPAPVSHGMAQLTSASVEVAAACAADADSAGGAECVTRDGAPYVAPACDPSR